MEVAIDIKPLGQSEAVWAFRMLEANRSRLNSQENPLQAWQFIEDCQQLHIGYKEGNNLMELSRFRA